MSLKKRILYSGSLLALLAGAQGAYAQEGTADEPQADEIIVTGQRASLEAAKELKRNSDQVIEAIVADDIGKFPDTTVAAALQRVPGVQVVNGFNNEIESPLIRGIGDILTTLDGREIFTGVGRGFAFQDLPAEALAGADVYKSNSANLIEGGVAGVINLKLQKPFNFEDGTTIAANVRGLYGTEVEKLSWTAGALVSHRWEGSGGEFGVLLDASYSDQHFNRPISFNCDPRSANHGPPGATNLVLPTCVGGLTDTGSYQRPQVNAAFQWRPTPELEFYLDGLFAGYRAKFGTYFIFSDIFGAQSITNAQGTDECFSARVDGAGFRGRLPTPTDPGDPIENLCFGSSATFNNVAGLTSTQAKTGKTDTFVFGGGTRYNSDAVHIDLDLSYVKSKNSNRNIIVDIRKQIDTVNIQVDDNGHGTTDMPGDPLGDPAGFPLANSLFQDINKSDSSLFAVKVDGAYDLDSFVSQLQFGMRYGDRSAHFRSNAPGGPPAPNTPVASAGLPSDFLILSPASIPFINGGARWYTPDADYLRNNTDDLRVLYGGTAGDPPFDPARNYDASEKTYAVYGQAKYEFELGGGITVDGLVGARLTRTDRTISGTGLVRPAPTPANPNPPAVLTPVTRSSSDSDILPNASARVRLMPELQLRFTYAKTIAQPLFGNLNPGLTYQVPINANIRPNGSGGNPDLRPQKSDAFDATLEYYFGRSSYISAALYYRKIKDRIVIGSAEEEIDGIFYNISRPRNLGRAKLKGIELSSQVFFDFLPEGFDGLGMMANFTLADSEVTASDDELQGAPLLGVSKYSYNIGGLYEKYGFTARVVYTWRSGYDEFQFGGNGLLAPGDGPWFNKVKANGRLDFSVSYDITPQIAVSVDGVNVLGGKYLSYFDTKGFPHDIRVDDTFYGMSVRAKF
ncbi:TonB-dependent receptor [Sphingomonas cavernae]|uniref:TonB-dependent receptor n=1 Tax=Sphingomonas cavernae TaxID=2320861 RepID=A0A418WKR2_9SPHN|nr:TonB-dependent receptor [Sphingomonas cavernae]RJF90631.1 TonB-dependent receptor [Sphingomonas cavernae]